MYRKHRHQPFSNQRNTLGREQNAVTFANNNIRRYLGVQYTLGQWRHFLALPRNFQRTAPVFSNETACPMDSKYNTSGRRDTKAF